MAAVAGLDQRCCLFAALCIVNGADPRRILLMTFSRRAATEMIKRVERISRKAMGDKAGIMTDALTWAGTFHGIGARINSPAFINARRPSSSFAFHSGHA
jgi:superfamily I DNA/RNA helicase